MKKLKYIAKYIIIVLLPLIVAISSCNDEGNLVNQNEEPYQFDSARYEWRTNTLYNSLMRRLFGFDTSHVYFLGTNSLNIYKGESYSSHFLEIYILIIFGGLDNSNIYFGVS